MATATIIGHLVAALLAISPAVPAHPTPSAFDLPLAPERFDWTSPLAQRNDLFAVRGTRDGRQIWAVGATGTIISLRGDDAKLEASGTDADLYALWVAAANDIWVVGARGTILHGDGKRWAPVRSGTKRGLYSIWGRSPQDIWVGGEDGTVLHREDNRFIVVPVATKGPISSVTGCERDAVCVLTLAGELPRIDRSNAPCDDPDGDCPADEPAEPAGNRILRWSNGRWSTIPSIVGFDSERMVSARTGFWVIEPDRLSLVRNGKPDIAPPIEHPKVSPNATAMIDLFGLWARSDDDGWVVGDSFVPQNTGAAPVHGAIWHVDGHAASLRPEVPQQRLSAVWAWSKTGAIAVGQRGTIVRYDGQDWKAVSKPVTDVDLLGVWSTLANADKSHPGLVGLRAHDTDDQPGTVSLIIPEDRIPWGMPKASASPRTRADADVWLIGDCEAERAQDRAWVTHLTRSCQTGAANRKILVLDSGDVWLSSLSHWDGRAWNLIHWPAHDQLIDLWASSPDDVWLAGGHDVVRWDGHALVPVAPVPGLDARDRLAAIWGADAKNVWVAATNGIEVKLFRWDGERWDAPLSFGLGLPDRKLPYPLSLQELLPTSLREQSGPVTLWGTAAADVWLAGPNGIVLRNDGDRWRRVVTPTRERLFGLGGTPDHVVAVGAAGTILELARP